MSDNFQLESPQDLLASLRFQLTSILHEPQWKNLSDEEFARALYVAVRRLQEERDVAVATLERVQGALAPQNDDFYSADDE